MIRCGVLLTLALIVSDPSLGQPDAAAAAGKEAQVDRDDARWAELEAQRRATDGDYDGAVQAHQQAEQALQEANRRHTIEQLSPGRR